MRSSPVVGRPPSGLARGCTLGSSARWVAARPRTAPGGTAARVPRWPRAPSLWWSKPGVRSGWRARRCSDARALRESPPGLPWLPTLVPPPLPPPRVGTLRPSAPRLPWLPALALRGSALTGPGARCRFTPKASDARSRLLRLIARISGFRERIPEDSVFRRRIMTTGASARSSQFDDEGSLTSAARAAADWLQSGALTWARGGASGRPGPGSGANRLRPLRS